MTTVQLLIYNTLRAGGLSRCGALGLMGNWVAESGLEAGRVQGDFSYSRDASRTYTAAVTAGTISLTSFSTDSKGYGLAQWTYPSRKQALHRFWKSSGKALDDPSMQTVFALHELSTDYPALYAFLRTTESLWSAADRVCREYEMPAYNNVDARCRAAQRLEEEINKDDDGLPVPSTWPPRTVDASCTGWPEVILLQALLLCRGYNVLIDGIYGDSLRRKVALFQQAYDLERDGVVGPLTWKALLAAD